MRTNADVERSSGERCSLDCHALVTNGPKNPLKQEFPLEVVQNDKDLVAEVKKRVGASVSFVIADAGPTITSKPIQTVTAGLPYRFTAFFKTGHVPPSDHQIQLQGAWTH